MKKWTIILIMIIMASLVKAEDTELFIPLIGDEESFYI